MKLRGSTSLLVVFLVFISLIPANSLDPVDSLSSVSSSNDIAWLNKFGTEYHDISRTVGVYDGGLFVGGYTKSFGKDADAFFARLSPIDGNVDWFKTFEIIRGEGLGAYAEFYHINDMVFHDGKVYTVGTSFSYFYGPTVLVSCLSASDGSVQWIEFVGGDNDEGYAICYDQGTLYVTGTSYEHGEGQQDDSTMLVASIDASDGSLNWFKVVGETGMEKGNSILCDGTTLFVGGESSSYGQSGNDYMAVLATMNPATGQLNRYVTFGGGGWDSIQDMEFVGNDILVTGFTSSYQGEYHQGFITRIDKALNSVSYFKSFGLEKTDKVYAMDLDGENAYVTGFLKLPDPDGYDAFVGNFSAQTGDCRWLRRMGGSDWDEFYSICVHEQSILTSGRTRSFGYGVIVSRLPFDYIQRSDPDDLEWTRSVAWDDVHVESVPVQIDDQVVSLTQRNPTVGDITPPQHEFRYEVQQRSPEYNTAATEVLPNQPPYNPTNTYPQAGSTDISLTTNLGCSQYSDPNGDPQKASRWQVTGTQGDYSEGNLVFDSGIDEDNLRYISMPPGTLESGNTYYWRTRHQDELGAWSDWSDETSFSTETVNIRPNPPINVLPASGSTDVGLTPSLMVSVFVDPDGHDHLGTIWQVTTEEGVYTSGNIVFDSYLDTVNKYQITIPAGRLVHGTTYYWHAAFADVGGQFSDWSTETSFTTIQIPNDPPHKPGNSLPPNGATDVSLSPNLMASTFSDPDGHSHKSSRWQVTDRSGDYSQTHLVFDSGTDGINLTSILVPLGKLSTSTVYYWRVSYQDQLGGWSPWSDETSFTTGLGNSPPTKPTNQKPIRGDKLVGFMPTLNASQFFDIDQDRHWSSWWQITNASGDFTQAHLVFDSGETGIDLRGIRIWEKLPGGTTYFWRVRYRDTFGLWSAWSDETNFTTLPPLDIESPTDYHGLYSEVDASNRDLDIIGMGFSDTSNEYILSIEVDGWYRLRDNYWYGALFDTDSNSLTGMPIAGIGADLALAFGGTGHDHGRSHHYEWLGDGWSRKEFTFAPTRYHVSDDILSVVFNKDYVGPGSQHAFAIFATRWSETDGTGYPLIPSNLTGYEDVMPNFGGFFKFDNGELKSVVPFNFPWSDNFPWVWGTDYFLSFLSQMPYGKYAGLSRVVIGLYTPNGTLVETIMDTDRGDSICRGYGEDGTTTCSTSFFNSADSTVNPGFIFDSTGYPDGDYELRAVFTDVHGSKATPNLEISIDNVDDPPEVYTSPEDGGRVGGNATIQTWSYDFNWWDRLVSTGLDAPDWVTVNSRVVYSYFNSRMMEYEVEFEGVTEVQNVTLTAWATDNAGTKTSVDITLTVDPCQDSPNATYCADYDGDGIVARDDCDDTDSTNTKKVGIDTDGDGVADCFDKCLNAKGWANLSGCAAKEDLSNNFIKDVCSKLDPLQWCDITDTSMSGRLTCLGVVGISCSIEFLSEFYPALEVLGLLENIVCSVAPNAYEAGQLWTAGDTEGATTAMTLTLKAIATVAFDVMKDKLLDKFNVLKKYEKLISIIECLDSAVQLSDEVVKALMPIVYDTVGGMIAWVKCPVDISIIDGTGNRVGLGIDGLPEMEIQDSFYGEIRDLKFAAVPLTNETYTLLIEGKEEGEFDLEIWTKRGEGVERVLYNDVTTTAETVARLPMGPGSDRILEIDLDGDGNYEKTKSPDQVIVDSDGDGVPDGMDFCPSTASGCLVDERGCPIDSDHDSVCDGLDRCPKDLSGMMVSERGCPLQFITPENMLSIYRGEYGENLGVAIDWETECPCNYQGDVEIVEDPKDVFGEVALMKVEGYGRGTTTSSMAIKLTVPPIADIVSIPLATGLHGTAKETDAEDGVEISVREAGGGNVVWTYASQVMDKRLEKDYILAYGDVSGFRAREVELTITLRQVDVCGGSSCTHNADLYIGDLTFLALPDVCVTQNRSLMLYDYFDDPTPTQVESHPDPESYSFLDVRLGPFNRYGAGEDTYSTSFELTEDFELLEFNLYYGYYAKSLTINGHVLSAKDVHQAFPLRSGTYVNLPEVARYIPINRNPEAVEELFVPGHNEISMTIYAQKSWEERPFDLYARFKVPQPMGILLLILLILGLMGAGRERANWSEVG